MTDKLVFARVTGGNIYNYLKDIDIVGRVDDDGDLIVYGCKDEDQPKFYQGLLEMDKADPVQGWETVEEVKEWWEEGADMLLTVDKGDFTIVPHSHYLAK